MKQLAVKAVDIGANLVDGMFQGEYYDKKKHDADLQSVIERSFLKGVDFVVTVACHEDFDIFQKYVVPAYTRACEKLQIQAQIKHTLGFHPTNATKFTQKEQEWFRDYLTHNLNDITFVGELGLDYDRFSYSPKCDQQKAFAE